MTIPMKHQDFCKRVAELAQAHGLNRCTLKIQPGWASEDTEEVTMYWEAGRHGESGYVARLSSTRSITVNLDKGTAND